MKRISHLLTCILILQACYFKNAQEKNDLINVQINNYKAIDNQELFQAYGILNAADNIKSSTLAVPNQPANPSPANAGTTLTLSPNVCSTVSDPDGGSLRVRFYGRKKPAGGSGKFTTIVLPDTQYYTEEPQGNNGGFASMFNSQTAWIIANRVSNNIVFVGHLGDCVQNGDNPPGSNNEIEYQRVVTAISPIESAVQTGLAQGIPFSLCVGNHDQTPNGSAAGTTTYFNQFFGSSHFAGRTYYGGHYGSNNDNHYEIFSASGVDFLVISFEYDQLASFTASGGPLEWAEGLVQTYPNRKVIILTHYGINEDQSYSVQGQAIYTRLKNYSNYILLLCGHVHSTDGEARRSDVFAGRTVNTLLSDYQGTTGGGNGQLRIYEFDPQQNTLSAKTYSPFTNTFQTDDDSQFTIPVNLGAYSLIGEVSNASSGTNVCANWAGLLELTEYEWYAELYDGVNTTFGPLWTFTTPPNPPLPVNDLAFTASAVNKKVQLNWKTESELNNHHFNIERSENANSFIKLGEVGGSGTTSMRHMYSFIDDFPVNGRSWYRLQQVDVDGYSKYSNIVPVKFGERPTCEISPNPISGSEMNIIFSQSIKGESTIQIHDLKGNEVYNNKFHDISGNIKVKMNFPAGTYLVKVIGTDIQSTKKVILTRK
ncbi:MAG: T9SS type A sorting domain-containing protein [Ferruginibacter sp.]